MNSIDWLCAKAPGFEALSQEERDAIMHFALLWSLFEAAVLYTHACSISIIETAKRWEAEGQLKAELFGDCLTYFRNRHFQNNEFTEHFAGLHFRKNDNQQLGKLFCGPKETGGCTSEHKTKGVPLPVHGRRTQTRTGHHGGDSCQFAHANCRRSVRRSARKSTQ